MLDNVYTLWCRWQHPYIVKLQHEPDHARKAIGELTVITVGYHRRINHVLSFLFFYCFFDFQKKLLFFGKNKVTKKVAKVITILVIHKSKTAAETIVISSPWSSNVFKRALLIWRWPSSSVGQICSNTAILIPSCNFTRFPDGSVLVPWSQIQPNFQVSGQILRLGLCTGLRMRRNNDPFRLPVAGSYLLFIFLQASPSSKFCNTAYKWADFSWISTIHSRSSSRTQLRRPPSWWTFRVLLTASTVLPNQETLTR